MSAQQTAGALRTGADYLASLGDGRRVWIDGTEIDDVRTHPATAGVVATHAQWYDRHSDPAWAERLLTPEGRPIAFETPRSGEELLRLQELVTTLGFETAGNITHDPGYGALIIMGAYDAVSAHGPADRAEAVTKFYESLTSGGRFAAAPYAPAIADRFRAPADHLKPTVVAEREDGVVVRGMVGLGTGMPFAEVLFTAPPPGPLPPEQALWFSFPVAADGVRLVARQSSSHGPSPTEFPLSTRYDELEATVILDDVFVPWEDVYVYRDTELSNRYFDGHVMWLAFHHLARILGRVEYTIGLALAVTDALNTNRNPAVQNVIVDMIFHAETIKAALTASCARATISDAGVAVPDMRSLAAGTKYALQNRASFADTARTLAGFGSMLAPVPAEFDDPDVGSWLTQSYGGGTWTGRQRARLLHLVRDHLASALDSREAAFESLASGGTHLWNMRVRVGYERYEELATRAMGAVGGDVPAMDFGHMRELFAKPPSGKTT